MKNTKVEKNTEVVINGLTQIGEFPIASTKQIYEIARANGFTYASARDTFMVVKSGRGKWNVGGFTNATAGHQSHAVGASESVQMKAVTKPQGEVVNLATSVQSVSNDEVYIPKADPTFVPWGEFLTIKKIIQSNQFFPLYISGMSGNGKTMMVEQACAKAKREYVRVQISPETDEDDLIGGFRLINGETVFQKGPVLKAMEAGCILLIDEIDRGTNKIMCLQGVLEGKPVLCKKTGHVIHPAPGFNVIATANTKGRGSDDGRYTAAQIIDDAFVERFVASIDQQYPEYATELKIVKKHMDSFDGIDDKEKTDFSEKLVAWSAVIRKTYNNEGVDELISTRRLCHIVKAFSIFNKRLDAIKMCISRFDEETHEAFLDLYTKIDNNEIDAEGDNIQTNAQDDSSGVDPLAF